LNLYLAFNIHSTFLGTVAAIEAGEVPDIDPEFGGIVTDNYGKVGGSLFIAFGVGVDKRKNIIVMVDLSDPLFHVVNIERNVPTSNGPFDIIQAIYIGTGQTVFIGAVYRGKGVQIGDGEYLVPQMQPGTKTRDPRPQRTVVVHSVRVSTDPEQRVYVHYITLAGEIMQFPIKDAIEWHYVFVDEDGNILWAWYNP